MKRGEDIELTIEDYAFGGKGIARIAYDNQQFIVFVEQAIPGQRVLAKVTKKRKKFAECRLIEVIENSPFEREIKFQKISGAPFITVPLEKQKQFKQESVLDVFRRIGEISNAEDLLDNYIESPSEWNYRNKMEYSFSSIRHDIEKDVEVDDFALGFKSRGTWWKVENLDKPSGLFDEEFEAQLHLIRQHCEKTGLPAWHPPKKTGFWRHIVVRKSFAQNALLINLVTSSGGIDKFKPLDFLDALKEVLGERLAGFQHTINDNVADRAKIENGSTKLYYGNPVIIEELLGLKFEISMESFFQTNPKCAELLYAKAIDFASEGNDLNDQVIMDLFCGTGTIGQLIASKTNGTEIIGVDIVEEAIENAKRNAALNGVENIKFFAADVGKFLLHYPEYEGKIGTIVLDPPRAGIAPKTLRKVMRLGAKRIVYVSCNPATQARDFIELKDFGYEVRKFSLVDQFPHTSHVESVAMLVKE